MRFGDTPRKILCPSDCTAQVYWSVRRTFCMRALQLDRAVDATPSPKAIRLRLTLDFSFRPLDGFSIVYSIISFVFLLNLLMTITFPCPFLALFARPTAPSTSAAPKIPPLTSRPPSTSLTAASGCVCCSRGRQNLCSRKGGGCALEPAAGWSQ